MDIATKAIAEPNRRRILDLVSGEEMSAGQISEHFDVTRPAVSQHLAALKSAGLLTERREGTRRLYRTRPEGFIELNLFLQSFWDDRLRQLKHAAEQGEDTDVVSERVSVQREVLISASREVVWGLLTEGNRVTQWMGLEAEFDASAGGTYRLEVVPGQFAVGAFTWVDPPARLAFTWGWEGGAGSVPPGSTIVVFEAIDMTRSTTLLRLTHQDLPDIPSAGSHARGWSHYIERLAMVAKGEDPGPDPWVSYPDTLMAELRPATEQPRDGKERVR